MRFHRAGSHEVRPIDHCYIASPLLVEAIAKFSEAAKRPEWPGFLRSLELFTNESELQMNIVDSTRPVAARFFDWLKTLLPSFAAGAISIAREERVIGSAVDRSFRRTVS